MKVILTEKVPALGNVGDIVNVSMGHARNYLIPNRFAVVADENNKKQLDNQKRALSKKIDAQKADANALKNKIQGLSLELIRRVGLNGKLFGTVTTVELSRELANRGIEVERRLLHVENPIKGLGTYKVKAKIFSEVEAQFEVKIAIDPVQAEEFKVRQEEMKKAAEKRKADEAKAAAEKEANPDAAPQTEEQRLQAEADKLLRS
jgi:large subunit ribosomal protein L9